MYYPQKDIKSIAFIRKKHLVIMGIKNLNAEI